MSEAYLNTGYLGVLISRLPIRVTALMLVVAGCVQSDWTYTVTSACEAPIEVVPIIAAESALTLSKGESIAFTTHSPGEGLIEIRSLDGELLSKVSVVENFVIDGSNCPDG